MFSLKLCFAVAAENVNDFMANHFFDVFSCGFKILSGVKVIRMLDKMLTDGTGAYKTKVGVDVDFANCHFCCFAKKFFGNTDCIGHLAAEFVNNFYPFLRNGRRTVENDWETRDLLLDLSQDVETQWWWNQDTVSVACALLWLELVSTV